MSLDLHTQCLERLTDTVAKGLESVAVEKQIFLRPASALSMLDADSVLPSDKRRALQEHVSDNPVFDFVFDRLSTELIETQKYTPEKPISKLMELDGYADLRAVATRLVGDLCSLPWQYALSIRLPNGIGSILSRVTSNYALSDAIRLVTPDDAFSAEYPLSSGIEARDRSLAGGLQGQLSANLLRGHSELRWDTESALLQVYVKGFIGMYGTTAPLEDAVDYVKSFLGIAIALRLLRVEKRLSRTPSEATMFVHRKATDKWIIERKVELDPPQSETFEALVIHDLGGSLNSEEAREAWAQRILHKIKCVFSQEPRSRRLLLASQWLFDSYCGSNELLSFVQTAVVIEILLGDKAASDLMGLSELLRNRCAYLISATPGEREMVLRDFRSIYDVRSKIVHKGKKRLSSEEQALFTKLQWICQRVILKESELFQTEAST
jgi:hypothetical protein